MVVQIRRYLRDPLDGQRSACKVCREGWALESGQEFCAVSWIDKLETFVAEAY